VSRGVRFRARLAAAAVSEIGASLAADVSSVSDASRWGSRRTRVENASSEIDGSLRISGPVTDENEDARDPDRLQRRS
jgi:hypothetical protein